jgi:hypothetical protein
MRKIRPNPPADFVPWSGAHFQTKEVRDGFLLFVAATLSEHDVEAEPMVDEVRGAMVRWRPGNFLGLNDVVYAHGGRIVLAAKGRGHLTFSSH